MGEICDFSRLVSSGHHILFQRTGRTIYRKSIPELKLREVCSKECGRDVEYMYVSGRAARSLSFYNKRPAPVVGSNPLRREILSATRVW